MQDSLEDYLKFTKNAKQDDPIKISKEMIVTAQMKKESDARAMKIVEFSIEGKLRPEVFTKCLPFINQSHYQDIVEERAITKLCGYSLCGKRIPEMPKKQYFISSKSNRVYDITERKNFCSNFCYKASLHIKNQIDNSPLWLRKLEDVPEYKLLHSSEGLPGEYIDQGIVKPAQVFEHQFNSIGSFTEASLDDLVRREVKSEKSRNNKRSVKKASKLKSTMQTIKENEVEEETQVAVNNSHKLIKTSNKVIKKEHKISCVVSLPSIEEQEIEDKGSPGIKENNQKKEDIEKNLWKNIPEIKIEDTSLVLENQSSSIDCTSLVLEKESTEECNLEPNMDTKEDDLPNTSSLSQENQKEKPFPKLSCKSPTRPVECKPVSLETTEKLVELQTTQVVQQKNSIDRAERKPSKSKKLIKRKSDKKTVQKPKSELESIIKKAVDEWFTLETCIIVHGEEEVKKVLSDQAFSEYLDKLGNIELQMEQQLKYMEICRRLQLQELADERSDRKFLGNTKLKPLPEFSKLKEDTKDMTVKVKAFYEGTMYEQNDNNFPTKLNKKPGEGEEEEGPPAVLPPVDVNSQNLLRRKIFLNSLNKAMHQLLQSLGVPYISAVLSDLQVIVKTFSLKADNITFKPIVWNYVAVVLLELISMKDHSIREILKEERSQEIIELMFDALPNKRNFVSDVLNEFSDIEKFVEKYISKTVGTSV